MRVTANHPIQEEQLLTLDEWIIEFRHSIGSKGSNLFVPLTAKTLATSFEELITALLAKDLATARSTISRLHDAQVYYKLVQIKTPQHDGPIYGFLERAPPGSSGYRGWGAVLVRSSGGNKVYQAPHVQADAYTTRITARAFYEDPEACAAFFAGTHRYANHNSFISDVAHTTTNLFHALTVSLAQYGQRRGTPFWFIQFHGAANRSGEPAIIGSDGTGCMEMAATNPLIHISACVNRAGYVDMGICGWRDPAPSTAHGRYRLRATRNVQGQELERLGLRHTFMHFELAQHVRAAFHSGASPGYHGMLSLFYAIRKILDQA